MLASRCSALIAAEARRAPPPRAPKSCTTDMPDRCSWRNALRRATAVRTSRKLTRARLLNQSVSRKSSGRMAKVASARRTSSATSTAAMPASSRTSPTIETMPAVNSSLSASTSVVTRVTRRPTGVRVEVGELEPLQVGEDVAPQVGHHALAHRLQQVALRVERDEGGEQRGDVDGRATSRRPRAARARRRPRPAGRRPSARPASGSPRPRPPARGRGRSRPKSRADRRAASPRRPRISASAPRASRRCGAQVAEQAPHQAAVVGPAQRPPRPLPSRARSPRPPPPVAHDA